MYGAEFSLYSGKLRSYLRNKGIEFTEIQPWLMTYKKFIVPRTGVRYIPVLQTPEDEVWQDTTVIIDHMEQPFPQPSVYPATPRRKLAALILELFCDEWLLGDLNEHFLHNDFLLGQSPTIADFGFIGPYFHPLLPVDVPASPGVLAITQ